MGRVAAVPLLFFVGGLIAVAQAQTGGTTITDFTVLVDKDTSSWDHFNFSVNDEGGDEYFCSTPFDFPLNSAEDPGKSSVSK